MLDMVEYSGVDGLIYYCLFDRGSHPTPPLHLSFVITGSFWFVFKPCVIYQVKIRGENVDMLKAAAEQFLDKSISQIQNIALETLVRFIPFR